MLMNDENEQMNVSARFAGVSVVQCMALQGCASWLKGGVLLLIISSSPIVKFISYHLTWGGGGGGGVLEHPKHPSLDLPLLDTCTSYGPRDRLITVN